MKYNKNDAALLPPMGWNSYDRYDTAVTEDEVKSNADVMASKLKLHGYEYVVVDIQWSDPDAGKRAGVQYIPFSRFCIDEYSRQVPAPNRFPSSAGGEGFKPLADYIHSLGLKFGIHIMRGIPRFACHDRLPIKTANNRTITADMIANPYSISKWNPDMYGVDMSKDGAQDYYDSIFALYAEWGVDFVKVDDICNTNMYLLDPYSGRREIEAMALAIQRCGRPIVLSLSPGPAVVTEASHLARYANMWRITDDFWDEWYLLRNMFFKCDEWQKHCGPGTWPDCDMLPLGTLGTVTAGGGRGKRQTNFTPQEIRTMFTLWCVFRSPLMLGCCLTELDEETISVITNDEVLAMTHGNTAHALTSPDSDVVVWESTGDGKRWICFFNLTDNAREVCTKEYITGGTVRDLWTHQDLMLDSNISVKPHDVKAFMQVVPNGAL